MSRILPAALFTLLTTSLTSLISTAASAQPLMPERVRVALDSVLDRAIALELTPGLGVAIVRDGRIVYQRGAGWADREAGRRVDEHTIFYIASSTKSFVALATILLDRDGVLDLDATLAQILPGVRLADGLDPRTITVRQLLSHTHGISGNGPVSFRAAFSGEIDRREMIAAIRAHAPAENGTAFAYSNLGYNILSLAIDSIAGKPWQDVLAERVLRPLGMRSTSARVSELPRERLAMPYRMEPDGLARMRFNKHDANMQAAGGMMATTGDLARFTIAMMDGGMLDGQRVFPADVVAEALRSHARFSSRFGDIERVAYSLGWNHGVLGGDTLIHHFGGFPGFSAAVSFMPGHRIGVVIGGNGAASQQIGDLVMALAYAMLTGNTAEEERLRQRWAMAPQLLAQQRGGVVTDRERRAARPQTTPLPMKAYTGRYEDPTWGSVEVSVRDGRLYVVNGVLESEAEVFDGTTHRWRVELSGSGSVLQFFVEDGRVTAVSQGGGSMLRRVR
jgi:CubicO group peptidase (beta-lactamase class C family)